jgi:predicted DCC family thiol-disulfide oxidoreductase YuxK
VQAQPISDLTILYDGQCSLCRASVARVRRMDSQHRVELLDLHDPSVPQRFPQVDREIAMRWMQAVDMQKRVFSGVDAWAQIGRRLPGWNLLAWLLLVPGVHWLATKIYSWVARNRYRWNREACADGTCAVHLPNSPDAR